MSFVDEKIVSLIKNLSIFSFSFFRFYYINFGFVFTIIFYHYASTRAHLYDTTAIEIQISNGRIRGEYGSLDGENYVVFRGIPYAAPPVGAARFQVHFAWVTSSSLTIRQMMRPWAATPTIRCWWWHQLVSIVLIAYQKRHAFFFACCSNLPNLPIGEE